MTGSSQVGELLVQRRRVQAPAGELRRARARDPVVHEDRHAVRGPGDGRGGALDVAATDPQARRDRGLGRGGVRLDDARTATRRRPGPSAPAPGRLHAVERRVQLQVDLELGILRERVADDPAAERRLPVESGPVRVVHQEVRVGAHEATAGPQRRGQLRDRHGQRLVVREVVEHLTGDDQIEPARQRVGLQVESRVLDGVKACGLAPRARSAQRDGRDVRRHQAGRPAPEGEREVALRTADLHRPPDGSCTDHLHRVLVLAALVGALVTPRIGAGREQLLEVTAQRLRRAAERRRIRTDLTVVRRRCGPVALRRGMRAPDWVPRERVGRVHTGDGRRSGGCDLPGLPPRLSRAPKRVEGGGGQRRPTPDRAPETAVAQPENQCRAPGPGRAADGCIPARGPARCVRRRLRRGTVRAAQAVAQRVVLGGLAYEQRLADDDSAQLEPRRRRDRRDDGAVGETPHARARTGTTASPTPPTRTSTATSPRLHGSCAGRSSARSTTRTARAAASGSTDPMAAAA